MKIIKMSSVFILVISMCALLSFSSFAANNTLHAYKTVHDTIEFETVKADIKNSSYIIVDGIKNINYDNAYKLYTAKDTYFADAILAGGSIKDIVSDDYIWLIPCGEKGLLFVKKYSDGKFDCYASGDASGIEGALFADFDIVNAAIAQLEKSGEKVLSVIITESQPYFLKAAVLIVTSSQEYIIPFSMRPDFTKLENGKLYKAQEICKVLSENFQKPEPPKEGELPLYGSAAGVSVETAQKQSPSILAATSAVIVTGVALIILAIVSIVLKRKKTDNPDG